MKRNLKKVNLKEAGVNITPLMDVLTVLLFFLIQSLEVSSLTLTPPKDIKIPLTKIKGEHIENAIRIFLSPNELKIDEKVIVKLNQQKFDKGDLDFDGKTIKALKHHLIGQIEKRKNFYKDVTANIELPPSKVIITAHKDLPFGVLKYLLHTLTISEYDDYQFVVVTK